MWGLIIYIVTKIISGVSKVLKSESKNDPLTQPHQNKNSRLNIDKKDIIEAKFEEVKSNKDTK